MEHVRDLAEVLGLSKYEHDKTAITIHDTQIKHRGNKKHPCEGGIRPSAVAEDGPDMSFAKDCVPRDDRTANIHRADVASRHTRMSMPKFITTGSPSAKINCVPGDSAVADKRTPRAIVEPTEEDGTKQ